jgi:hypothetical protein
MANAIDTVVKEVQPSGREPVLNPVLSDPGCKQLKPRNHPVLLSR